MDSLHQIKVLTRYFRRYFQETLNDAIRHHLTDFNTVAAKYRHKHPFPAWADR